MTTPERQMAGVIEIGSTSVRMAIARRRGRNDFARDVNLDLPIGLGRDTFTDEEITRATTERCVIAIRKFLDVLKAYAIPLSDVRVVATSAVREARNRDVFTDRILIATGLPVTVLDEVEVSRLTYQAVHPVLRNELFFQTSGTLVVEVGGGSTEVLAFRKGRVDLAQVHRLGSLRMFRELGDMSRGGQGLAHMETYLSSPVDQMIRGLGLRGATHLVALGGEARRVRDVLRMPHEEHRLTPLTTAQVRQYLEERLCLSVEQLALDEEINEHQAETLLPALAIQVALAEAAGTDRLLVSDVSLRDGVLAEMFAGRVWEKEFRSQTIHAARTLARKYGVDRRHADNVAAYARAIFDFMVGQAVAFEPQDGTLLRVAALLHEIGMFVNNRAYHKHSLYLIENSEIFGLNAHEIGLVARIARYHRRAMPRNTHEEFAELPTSDRVRVGKLAAILRVADALELGHESGATPMAFSICRNELRMRARTTEDLTLVQGQLDSRAEMFETVFGLKVVLRAWSGETDDASE
jgi:exopolyphosphatase/guanosine-5'-triphosphate,3'-diphosphate pyrophosphatase